ncbi:MAG: type IX secretion system membrane protein PorP/SprF [Bacteroidota bacterium]
MMKRYYIWLLMFCSGALLSQQLPQYSQYMLNELAINPAVSGKDEFTDMRTNVRHQWVGITDAPRTYMLSVHGPIQNKNMGLGVNLYTDIVGPTRRTGLNFSYAYHLKLEDEMRLSMGVSAGMIQWGIDGSKITLREEGDQNLLNTYQTTMVPDFGAGVYFHKKDEFYVGFAVPQLYQAPIALYSGAGKNSKLVSQLNFNGAYKFELNDDFKIEPSFLLKYEKPAPPKIDLGARCIYQEQIWLGASYRHRDAVSILVGYLYKNYLMIGYSYDVSTTSVRKYSSGTHEIMMGIRFSKKQATTWEKTEK